MTALGFGGKVAIVTGSGGGLGKETMRNPAGGSVRGEMTPESLEPVLDVHVKGAFYVTRPAWVVMRRQGYGRVVNTSSGSPRKTNYGTAKTGMIGFIRGLAAEGAGHNIKINAVAPIAATRMLAQSLADADEVAQRRPDPEDGGTTPEWM